MGVGDLHTGHEFEFEEIERNEREARERLEHARERHRLDDGVIPHEHHELIHKLEVEWQQAVERLEHARRSREA